MVAAACCDRRRKGSPGPWVPCPGAATVGCDEDQANVTVSFTAKTTNSFQFGTEWSWHKSGSKLKFCADCTLIVMMANAQPLLEKATGKSADAAHDFGAGLGSSDGADGMDGSRRSRATRAAP
mmetsp:Transcript_1044/g.3287  ORF Transcript_1044/g.3287 Transcript_1044/m.3287 type:complete len:123 (-) Transcript_1044:807-1175(-)